jgi:hypothetical protein
MMWCGCACAAALVSKWVALGCLLVESAVAMSAAFGTGEAVGYLVCDDDGYVFGASKIAEELP